MSAAALGSLGVVVVAIAVIISALAAVALVYVRRQAAEVKELRVLRDIATAAARWGFAVDMWAATHGYDDLPARPTQLSREYLEGIANAGNTEVQFIADVVGAVAPRKPGQE